MMIDMVRDTDMEPDAERSRRQSRREFIWNNHPDRGGDQQAFIAGLAELEAQLERARQQIGESQVTIYRRRRGVPALAQAVLRWYLRRAAAPRVR